MKNYYLHLIVSALIFIGICKPLQAQQYDKKLAEVQNYITQGNYFKAADLLEIIEEKEKKRNQAGLIDKTVILQSKMGIAQGLLDLDLMRTYIAPLLASTRLITRANPLYWQIRQQIAGFHIQNGQPLHADALIDPLLENPIEHPDNASIKAGFLQIKVYSDMLKGNYILAGQNQAELLTKLDKIETEKISSYVIKSKKIPKDEKLILNKQYADGLLCQAQINSLSGDYIKAQSQLEIALKYCQKQLGGASAHVLETYMLMGQNAAQIGQISLALRYYSKAINKAGTGRNYTKTHRRYLEIQSVFAHATLEKDLVKGKLQALKYEKLAIVYGSKTGYLNMTRVLQSHINFLEEKHTQSIWLLTDILTDTLAQFCPVGQRSLALSQAYESRLEQDSLAQAWVLLGELYRYSTYMIGQNTPQTHAYKITMAEYHLDYTGNLTQAGKILQESWKKIWQPQILATHHNYVKYLNLHANFYEQADRNTLASENLELARKLTLAAYTDKSVEYAMQIMLVAKLQTNTGDYKQAELYLKEAMETVRKKQGRVSWEYVQLIRQQARLYVVLSLYDEAESLLNKSIKLEQKLLNHPDRESLSELDELALLYFQQGLYSQTEELLSRLLARRQTQAGSESGLIFPLTLLGQLRLEQGMFVEADQNLRQASLYAKKLFGDSSSRYAQILMSRAKLYAALGDAQKAVSAASKAHQILKLIYGPSHIMAGNALTLMARLQMQIKNNTTDVEPLFLKAAQIAQNNLGNDHPLYAESLQNLAFYYIEKGKYDQAEQMLLKADQIWQEKQGRQNKNTAEIMILNGDIWLARGDAKEAGKLYTKAGKMFEKIFDANHLQTLLAIGRQGRAAYQLKNYKLALVALERTTKAYLSYINNYFASLSDNEKNRFWAKVQPDFELFYAVCGQYSQQKPSLTGLIYDSRIATKAVLMGASIRLRTQILSSNNENLIEIYKKWLAKKEQLASLLTLGPLELKENGIDIKAEEQEAENLEKQLSSLSEEFEQGRQETRYSWKDIKKSLKDNEYAIEILRFRHFDRQFTDSVVYVALIVSKQTKNYPHLVILENGNHLETKNLNFYRNSIRYGTSDELSYNAFWKPIRDLIKPNATIYFSGDGVYNQINLETLQNVSNQAYVIEENNIILVSNTKDILNTANTKKTVGNKSIVHTAALFGNPQFYQSKQSDEPETIEPLPGSEQEIEQIETLMQKSKWKVESFMGERASEKQLNHIKRAQVLHFATHGFFMEDQQEDQSGAANPESQTPNPLLRSGLLLANAGELFGNQNANLNLKEGVLTAYEAMNLNLEGTELVVLSACETGLGKLSVGEGVYGLQRAFMVAGAQSIIMSLFKVPDESTRNLMNVFYIKWLTSGNRRMAFIEAKREMKKSSPNVLDWGAFVMVGR